MKRVLSGKYKIQALILMAVLLLTACGSASTAPKQESSTSATDASLTVTCLKAGAADAFVLISDNHVTIIDTGLDKKGEKLVKFLDEQGITRIDEMILTHFDKDHVGGADHVLENYEVGTVYTTYHSKESDDITEYLNALKAAGMEETEVTETISYEADGISFTIYPPKARTYLEKESNNSSLAIKVTFGENSMLFAGDAEYERLSELMSIDEIRGCTILKVPHHGRFNDNSRAFIEYVNPEYAVITSSKADPGDQEVLDALDSIGAATYFTKDGAITISITANKVDFQQ
ncbi:ComEC/Rec2 family competence protein [Butyrivibrio sp. CB08]|uniref:ComEC/Rec2 family competence protein n=1 Tax=Butyrivibrio sp. CB08 TaxID=2364879 RepID=UPI0013141679|nr:MBL fold metallo-hydrolase [Butyrivibrio sp. CB08]